MSRQSTTQDGKVLGATAVAVSTAAAACGVACVLPFALPAAALASFDGLLAWLAGGHRWVTAVAAPVVIAAWAWIAYRSYRSNARPAKATVFVMLIATAMLGLAVVWPRLEPFIIASLLR